MVNTTVHVNTAASFHVISLPGEIAPKKEKEESTQIVSWVPPQDTETVVLKKMEERDFFVAMTDYTRNQDKEYMRFIQFQESDAPLPSGVQVSLRRLKEKMEKARDTIHHPSCIRNPTLLKVRLWATVFFALAFIVLSIVPERVFLGDSSSGTPTALLVFFKTLSVIATAYGALAPQLEQRKKRTARKELAGIEVETNKILKEQRGIFVTRGFHCILDYVHATPCRNNPKMLNRLLVRNIITADERVVRIAQCLLLQKLLHTHWESSLNTLRTKISYLLSDSKDINYLLEPLIDTVRLIESEISTEPGRGLEGMRKNISNFAENCMRSYYREARLIQYDAFQERLEPSSAVYLAPIVRTNTTKERAAAAAARPVSTGTSATSSGISKSPGTSGNRRTKTKAIS